MKLVAAAVAVALAGLLLLIVAALGSGAVASAAAPVGGCAVTLSGAGGTGGGTAVPAMPQKTATLSAAQMSVARTIVGVGKGMGITERGTAIALATAMQESTLNPTAVSGRSVGIFQQQGSLYANVNRTDPASASAAFYRILLQRVPSYNDPSVDMAAAAQTVQASGAGASFYAAWETWATQLAAQLFTGTPATGGGGVSCTPGGGSGPVQVVVTGLLVVLPAESGITGSVVAPNAKAAKAIAAALSYLGTRYTWGGGNANGPSPGIPGDPNDPNFNLPGFDCSGLTLYSYAQAGVSLPRTAAEQLAAASSTVPFSAAQPGDLLFWGTPPHHVAIYLGQIGGAPYIVQAPQAGEPVDVKQISTGGDFRNIATEPWK